MKTFLKLIEKNRENIISRMVSYSNDTGDNQLFRDIWSGTIDGLKTTIEVARKNEGDPFCKTIESVSENRDLFFDIIGADKYLQDGFKYGISLALLKYQKYCFLEIIEKTWIPHRKKKLYSKFILLYFDRLEMKLAGEWVVLNENELLQAQKDKINSLKFNIGFIADLLGDISRPYLLLDNNLKILSANEAFVEIINFYCLPGYYYLKTLNGSASNGNKKLLEVVKNDNVEKVVPWINEDLYEFCKNGENDKSYMKLIDSNQGMIDVHVNLKRMARYDEFICITMGIDDAPE